ncbi:protein ITPRID2 isoform X2 [Mugil cephalus]|uniref:protein ITPRID2 isoform X2 n=1 Tax=Mugil cephalus TaxID=48193 RepID=UPI001FB5E486|nr:protein ITPRID2 isoform X2 [Mugil cephalus]
METDAAPDPRVKPVSAACLRRQAFAQSRDSIRQESKPDQYGPQETQQSPSNMETQRPSEGLGQVPNKIANWLSECRTPLGVSLDDRSASPSRGALRNGCSFEDDLSLGAEANHLQSSVNKAEPCFGLVADQKRSQYKERGRSMNSTGSGKSSTVSSVSELLDLYEEDPEEVLLNLGFGREEPDMSSKIPSRFFNSSSSARGIDIKVYLGAQLQRMELENPNHALTSRFRQIEVLTTVANEFFQLYSQVSGQPVQRISSKDQGGGEAGEDGGGGQKEDSPPLKRSNSAMNVAKLFKRTISKRNLHGSTSESPEPQTPQPHKQLNGHASTSDPASASVHAHTNGHAQQQDGRSAESEHQQETVSQKHIRKKDNFSLATVTEETNGDGETDRLTDGPVESSAGTEHPPESADLQPTNQRAEEEEEEAQVVIEPEKNLTSTPEKALPALAPPQLAQLRTENADSFDMEEIQSNEDEALPNRTSRASDLLRTVSQQSDSSGFAEEPSADSNGYLKVQDSSDSCDSETTVTSHPSQDVATPIATDQPAFDLPDGRVEEAVPGGAAVADGTSSSLQEDALKRSSEPLPQYVRHHLPRSKSVGAPQEETLDKEQVEVRDSADPEPGPATTPSMSAAEQEPQQTQNQIMTTGDPPVEGASTEDNPQVDPGLTRPPTSPVLKALDRAKQLEQNRTNQRVAPQSNEVPTTPGGPRGKRGLIPMQRSSSMPTSFLSPSKVVSSVRIEFGRGQASCTQPRYSFKYTQEPREDKEQEQEEKERDEDAEEEEEEQEEQPNRVSTLIINPSTSSKKTPSAVPPKPIPRYLMRSSYSLQSSSPPPDWSPRDHSWSTQSVPDLSSNQQHPDQFQQKMSANQNQPSWHPGQTMFTYPNQPAQYSDPSTSPSPSVNSSSCPFFPHPHQQYPSPLNPYASLPNLHHPHNASLNHHSSLTSLHHPTASPAPPHSSLSNLYHPSTSTAPHHVGLGHLHPGSPTMHHHGYSLPYGHQSPYHTSPHGSQFASPYLSYQGYNVNPHLAYPNPINQYPTLPPEHTLHARLTPSAPGFISDLGPTLGPGHNLHPGLGLHAAAPGAGLVQGISSTEMQLRRVLHEIRGTVQSLSQNQVDTPDAFSDRRTAVSSQQSLGDFQQKRRSLNLFRSQMMDLELSIIRQQALVYKHLSPADRLELEQLQSLRSAVREELQELEQQLEERLVEMTHLPQQHHRGLHRDSSIESLSTASALRAMEPVSDLLREQLLLQSELSYDGRDHSTAPSSRSSSPVRRGGGGRGDDGEQRSQGGVYRASISITPAPPPRPNTHNEEGEEKLEEEEEEEEEGERDSGEAGGRVEGPEEERAPGGIRVDNLQQLIREIRESVAQEVRQEIYNELLAAVSPRHSPLPPRQPPL